MFELGSCHGNAVCSAECLRQRLLSHRDQHDWLQPRWVVAREHPRACGVTALLLLDSSRCDDDSWRMPAGRELPAPCTCCSCRQAYPAGPACARASARLACCTVSMCMQARSNSLSLLHSDQRALMWCSLVCRMSTRRRAATTRSPAAWCAPTQLVTPACTPRHRLLGRDTGTACPGQKNNNTWLGTPGTNSGCSGATSGSAGMTWFGGLKRVSEGVLAAGHAWH